MRIIFIYDFRFAIDDCEIGEGGGNEMECEACCRSFGSKLPNSKYCSTQRCGNFAVRKIGMGKNMPA